MAAFTMCKGGSKHLQVNSCVTLLTEGYTAQQDGLLWPLFWWQQKDSSALLLSSSRLTKDMPPQPNLSKPLMGTSDKREINQKMGTGN